MKNITIGTVQIPLDSYTVGGTAILGIRESGKTYTAKGIAEQLLDYKVPIIVFDAIGVWRFLKVAGDGQGAKGFKVVVAGGKEPDLPLTPASAPEIVRAAIRENIPLVIDLYDKRLSKSDWRKIVQQCFRVLLYENEGLRHIFLEETAEYAPQKVLDGETYAEVEKLVRMGGNASLGITLINQRAQEINKAVLDLCENLVLMRQRGSNAIDSLEKWMDKLSPDSAAQVARSMPNMGQGDCWIFTGSSDAPERTKSKQIHSHHPNRRKPDAISSRSMADTGEFVQRLSGDLSKLIEEQKAKDPAHLQKRVADLEKQLKQQIPRTEVKEVPVFSEADKDLVSRAIAICESARQSCNQWTDEICKTLSCLQRIDTNGKGLPSIEDVQKIYSAPQRLAREHNRNGLVSVPRATVQSRPVSDSSLGRCERAILTALAQYPQGRTASQIAILTGYSVNSGGFNNSLSKLRTADFINRGQPMVITHEGLSALGHYDPLPAGEDLQQHWLTRLGKCEAAILGCVLAAWPDGRTSEEIAQYAGYSAASGGFNNSLSKLRTLELITRGQPIKASDDFFQ